MALTMRMQNSSHMNTLESAIKHQEIWLGTHDGVSLVILTEESFLTVKSLSKWPVEWEILSTLSGLNFNNFDLAKPGWQALPLTLISLRIIFS